MPAYFPRVAAVAAACLASIATAGAGSVPSIVVTPYYQPTSIAKAGSTVSVITREEIERSSAGTVAELLRSTPGVNVIESGGAGGQALVNLRGAEAGHTLVLIDGIRVNDPASARDEFDFATLSLTDVERIEILRGPQSALYGSDAMGGVINIITRRPSRGLKASATAEGGSYGSRSTTLSASRSSGAFSLLASGTTFANQGFSRVGDRDHGEPDGTEKYAGTVRGAIDGDNGPRLEFGLDGHHQASDIDKSATVDASGYTSTRDLLSGFGRLSFPALDGRLASSLTLFATETTRRFGEPTRDTDFRGTDIGAEYQGNLNLATLGSLTAGARFEQVTAFQKRSDQASPAFDDGRLLYAGYLLYQVPVDAHLNLSLAARHDGELGGDGFTTGRFAAVYDLPEIETRLRGSLGTGAKRPTSFQLAYNPALVPEQSVGADLGIEKTLFDGRLTVSATGFWNRFTDLIDFDGDVFTGTYKNIAAAETAGVEVAASTMIVAGVLDGTMSYTYLDARDLATGLPLERRPMHSGKVTLIYTGIDNLRATLSATVVGPRFNDDAATVRLPGYVRIDVAAAYRVNEALSLFARVENLLDADYQEVSGYNTAGLSAYAGLTWRH
ncbi:MAG: TonB-dependent receptor [Bauldia sp.]